MNAIKTQKPKLSRATDKQQSKLFIEKARELGADEDHGAADEMLGRLAKMPPVPRPKKGK